MRKGIMFVQISSILGRISLVCTQDEGTDFETEVEKKPIKEEYESTKGRTCKTRRRRRKQRPKREMKGEGKGDEYRRYREWRR